MSKDKKERGRFLGWQKTPIHQAFFGQTTKGGSNNQKVKMKHSTGTVQELSKRWFVLDASEQPIGRLASTAATLLMGKHKATYTPGADSGDFVAVINADKAYFTSNKAQKKVYYWHTGYPGGLKMRTAEEALQRDPAKVLQDAVYGMLPKNRVASYQLTHLKVFKGAEHKLDAQKPVRLSLKDTVNLSKLDLAQTA